MADKDETKDTGPITYRHVKDGREVTVRSNATRQIAEYDDHPNWKRA